MPTDSVMPTDSPLRPFRSLLGAVAFAVTAATSVLAADDARPGRYTMTPADGGFVRLDTETGAIALCAKRNDQWSCEPMPDPTASRQREIDRLEAENKALRDEVRRMEDTLGLSGPKPGEDGSKQSEGPKGTFELPSEQDVDKAFDYVQRMLKKFQERMRELEREQGPSESPGRGTPL